MATKREVDDLKAALNSWLRAYDSKVLETEAVKRQYVNQTEELKTQQAIIDGLEWQIQELRELVCDYHKVVLRLLCSEHDSAYCDVSCPLSTGHETCVVTELQDRGHTLGAEV